MSYLDQVLSFREVKSLINEGVEKSMALYLHNNGRVYIKEANNGYSKTGTNKGVELPDYPEVFHNCRQLGSNKIILVHNHPPIDGVIDTRPSSLDIHATYDFMTEVSRFGCVLVDHVIVSKEGYFSFRGNNLI